MISANKAIQFARSVGAIPIPRPLKRHGFRLGRRNFSTGDVLRVPTIQDVHPRLLEERPTDRVDVLVVGAGPAGLCAALKLKQLADADGKELRVLVLEKASEVGAHILSGNVLEPRALDELLPNWKDLQAPLRTPATRDEMLLLTQRSGIPLPHPPQMDNNGNFICSLSELTRWMGQQAENAGVEIYPGIAASEVLYSKDGHVTGVGTNDVGIKRDGTPGDNFERGMAITSPITIFAEGCHGSLTKQVASKFKLRTQSQTYGIGLKEVWEVTPENHQPGLIRHTLGWPMDKNTYAGGFVYHWNDVHSRPLVSIGYVIGLDYWNTNLSPYWEFQKWKTHPKISSALKGGTCLAYGARALNEGGYQSIPKLAFPGGVLIGCSAGFVNVPKIKGTHTAMKSGIVAAESIYRRIDNIVDKDEPLFLDDYQDSLEDSWVLKELYEVRNIRPSFNTRLGLWGGIAYSGLDALVFRGRVPWTFQIKKPDHEHLLPKEKCPEIEYPKPDGVLTFSLLENLQRSGTNHNDDQPAHLRTKELEKHVAVNLKVWDGPEQRFCPAGVYEYVDCEPTTLSDGQVVSKRFHINAQNCVHCKTCDIKDPSQDIEWTVPEGGGGPQYQLT